MNKWNEEKVTEEITNYIYSALSNSCFFSAMEKGTLSVATYKYASQQFKMYRDNLHKWVGLVQFKSPLCNNVEVEMAVLGIANHNVVEMEYKHGEMYCDHLRTLGYTDEEIKNIQPEKATQDYQESFVKEFGLDSHNFLESLAAFSAREMLASIRNTWIRNYLLKLGMSPSTWVLVHEEVEFEHFKAICRPIVKRYQDCDVQIGYVSQAMNGEIDRHIQWWDRMMEEAIMIVSV